MRRKSICGFELRCAPQCVSNAIAPVGIIQTSECQGEYQSDCRRAAGVRRHFLFKKDEKSGNYLNEAARSWNALQVGNFQTENFQAENSNAENLKAGNLQVGNSQVQSSN